MITVVCGLLSCDTVYRLHLHGEAGVDAFLQCISNHRQGAVPCLEAVSFRLVTADARVSPCGIVVDKVALGQVFLRILRLSPVTIIPPLLSIFMLCIRPPVGGLNSMTSSRPIDLRMTDNLCGIGCVAIATVACVPYPRYQHSALSCALSGIQIWISWPRLFMVVQCLSRQDTETLFEEQRRSTRLKL
jgi:hypothetical protein